MCARVTQRNVRALLLLFTTSPTFQTHVPRWAWRVRETRETMFVVVTLAVRPAGVTRREVRYQAVTKGLRGLQAAWNSCLSVKQLFLINKSTLRHCDKSSQENRFTTQSRDLFFAGGWLLPKTYQGGNYPTLTHPINVSLCHDYVKLPLTHLLLRKYIILHNRRKTWYPNFSLWRLRSCRCCWRYWWTCDIEPCCRDFLHNSL